MTYQTTGIQKALNEANINSRSRSNDLNHDDDDQDKDDCELVFLNAPRIATGDPDPDVLLNFGSEAAPFYEWFSYDWLGASYTGLEESIDYVNDFIDREGPFDALLGFSQGATMATILTVRMMKQVQAAVPPGNTQSHLKLKYKWKAVILVCGVDPSVYTRWKEGISDIKFPSIHIAGKRDLLYWRSQVLYNLYGDVNDRYEDASTPISTSTISGNRWRWWIAHSQGHVFPTPFYHSIYNEIRDAILQAIQE
ncbi:serine hydrolase-domain-containing protein [Obelidium mucronatum]|nr:serine hydrolase-domain-containing protein [Obelidium mucronatum]